MAVKLMKIENLEYENLRGFEKAAILVNYLGPRSITGLFKFLDDADIRKTLNLMQKYRVVPVHVTKKVLEEFYELINEFLEATENKHAPDENIIREELNKKSDVLAML